MKVLEGIQIYDILKGNLLKIIFVGATSIPVLTSSKFAGNSFNFSCVGWGLVSFIVSVRGENIFAQFSALGEGI